MLIEEGSAGLAIELRKASSEIAAAALTIIISMANAGYKILVKSYDNGKSDVSFEKDGGKRYFAFIFNNNDLLFYLRAPAKDIPFPEEYIEGGKAPERTTRINSVADAVHRLELINIKAELQG